MLTCFSFLELGIASRKPMADAPLDLPTYGRKRKGALLNL